MTEKKSDVTLDKPSSGTYRLMHMDLVTRSITKYQGNEGEEKAEGTWNFNFYGTKIKSYTFFDYQGTDALKESTTYRVDKIETKDITQISKDRNTVIRSFTTYSGSEGEEKAQLTFNYDFTGQKIKSYTKLIYDKDTLVKSLTYRTKDNSTARDESIKAALRSESFYDGNETEEKVQWTLNYSFDGLKVKTATHFDNKGTDTLKESVTYRVNASSILTTPDLESATTWTVKRADGPALYQIQIQNPDGTWSNTPSLAMTEKKSDVTLDKPSSGTYRLMQMDLVTRSITKYQGNEGEEKAEGTWNFNFDGTKIKSYTFFDYQGTDALKESTTYRVDKIETKDITQISKDRNTVIRSFTTYSGSESEEKAQLTFNYDFTGQKIKSYTKLIYDKDTLVKSLTYRTKDNSTARDESIKAALRSESFYDGNETKEKVQWTLN